MTRQRIAASTVAVPGVVYVIVGADLNMMLAIEDARFFEHSGVDYRGMVRAALANLREAKSQGASTITMQVARNVYLSAEKSYMRKIYEVLLTFKLEHMFTKEQILEIYMNQIFLGQRAYGFAAASEIYFGKPLKDITVAEAAKLATEKQLKKIQEFKGTVTAKGLLSTNPCEDIETDFSDNEDTPEVGGGGGSYDGGSEGPTGSQGGGSEDTVCLDVSLSVVCECVRSYPDWNSYLESMCGNGSNPGYDVTLVVTFTDLCPMGLNRCAPSGVIGVIEQKKDCDTSKEDLMNTFPDLTIENAEILANTINTYGRDFGINDNYKLRHFLSQIPGLSACGSRHGQELPLCGILG